jgi:hypothetical protein
VYELEGSVERGGRADPEPVIRPAQGELRALGGESEAEQVPLRLEDHLPALACVPATPEGVARLPIDAEVDEVGIPRIHGREVSTEGITERER